MIYSSLFLFLLFMCLCASYLIYNTSSQNNVKTYQINRSLFKNNATEVSQHITLSTHSTAKKSYQVFI